MDQKKKKVSAILYDRLSDDVVALTKVLNQTPNEFVNRLVEESLMQIRQKTAPTKPLETIKLARLMSLAKLSQGDQMLQAFLAKILPELPNSQAEWRRYVLEQANAYEGPLTDEVVLKIKARADKLVSQAAKERRTKKKIERK